MTVNSVTLAGEISHIESLRHTPAGLPLVSLRLKHGSSQMEAGMPRQIVLEIGAVAIGDLAAEVCRLKAGDAVTAQGFLSAKYRTGSQLVLHITQFVHHTQQTL